MCIILHHIYIINFLINILWHGRKHIRTKTQKIKFNFWSEKMNDKNLRVNTSREWIISIFIYVHKHWTFFNNKFTHYRKIDYTMQNIPLKNLSVKTLKINQYSSFILVYSGSIIIYFLNHAFYVWRGSYFSEYPS